LSSICESLGLISSNTHTHTHKIWNQELKNHHISVLGKYLRICKIILKMRILKMEESLNVFINVKT
jgi:hypothetical protein